MQNFSRASSSQCILVIVVVLIACFSLMYLFSRQRQSRVLGNLSEFHADAFWVQMDKSPDLSLLPNLTTLDCHPRKYAPFLNAEDVHRQPCFKAQLTFNNVRLLFHLLDTFAEIMLKHKLADAWYMHSGTLLGSLRHLDFIPWDDDVDGYCQPRNYTKRVLQTCAVNCHY